MSELLASLQSLPPEVLWICLLLTAFAAILLLHRWLGTAGLYVYMAVAIIGGNLHVLKLTQFSVFPDPVALGTILFSTTFLCTDILTEYHGAPAARKGVILGFVGLILFDLFLFAAIAFRPLDALDGELGASAAAMQGHLEAIFLPAPGILIASLAAYLISQFNDIWVFSRLRTVTKGKHLWLRNNLSTWISALVDSVVFSVLAFVVFSPDPVGWKPLIFTYILGTYGLRVAVAILDSPIVYWARPPQK
ncbi:MAG: queuosine precursor transporter, partial [Puniceicoccales bacterium]